MGQNGWRRGKRCDTLTAKIKQLAKLLIRCSWKKAPFSSHRITCNWLQLEITNIGISSAGHSQALSHLILLQHQPHSTPTPSPSPRPTPPSLRRVSLPLSLLSPLHPITVTSFSIFSIAILYQSISPVNLEKKLNPGTVHQNIYITIRAAPFTTLFAARPVFSCFRSSPEFAAEA